MSSSEEKKDQKELANGLISDRNVVEIILDHTDLSKINELAHKNYLEYDPRSVGEDHFRTFCFIKATVDFLHSKGVKLEVQYPTKSK